MHTFSFLIILLHRKLHPTIGSSRKGTGPKWVRDASGRWVRLVDSPIPEDVESETRFEDIMAEKHDIESLNVDPNEPRYTRAEVDIMVNEMLAAKLAEVGLVPQAHVQTSSFGLGKGKEP